MAQQLLELHTPAAYAGVEAWAARHPATDAGSLAWLVAGYTHYGQHEFEPAIAALLKAQAHAGELGDYCAYFLAGAYLNQGQSAPAMEILKTFATRYPDSIFARDAALLYASALITTGDAERAITVAAPYTGGTHPDAELTLGIAYLHAGQTEKGVELLRRIYYGAPASAQAADARNSLQAQAPGALPSATFAEQRERAELLAAAHRYSDAIAEYRSLLNAFPAEHAVEVEVLLGEALYRSNNRNDARSVLQHVPQADDEMGARRDYFLLELARSDNDEAQMHALLDHMRVAGPHSSWLQQALLSAGNMYLLRKDYASAAPYFAEIAERFPDARTAAQAHWKAAWLTMRQGKNEEAKGLFEEQIRKYPASGEVAPALYWRGRLAEEENDLALARACYRKETERFRNYYYADLARIRLNAINPAGDVAISALLAKIPQPEAPRIVEQAAPADNLRVQKSRLLENGGLYDFAVRELQMAAEEDDGSWVNREVARVYQEGGHYDRALEVLKHAVPAYFTLDLAALPRTYWEALFPRPYWGELTRYAAANQLDPYLVASLIRQESEFNPGVISYANAWGLMQVVPPTGSKLARELHISHFSNDKLLAPATNLELGTHFFRSLVDKFGGKVEYALAAYNAGPERVEDWANSGHFRDTAEFVESIPFTQTREYVQAIMRNAMVYRQLYGGEAETTGRAAAKAN